MLAYSWFPAKGITMVCFRLPLVVLFVGANLASTASLASSTSLQDVSAAHILQLLDLTSFQNSTGPSRDAGRRRPRDWFFTQMNVADGVATLERPNDWALSLRIIRIKPDGVIACFQDRALNGGSYATQSALRVVGDSLAGYRVAEEGLVEPTCSTLPGQG